MCRKVLSLSFTYNDSELEELDEWDSESPDVDRATPRAVAIRLSFGDENAPLSIETKVVLPVYREKIQR